MTGPGAAKRLQTIGEVSYTQMDSPVGKLLLAADAPGLRLLSFLGGRRATALPPEWKEDKAPFGEIIRQLQAYFGGELREFDMRLAPEGTEFQLRVWNSLRTIPYGETISYAQLAQKIGNPLAVRAVGLANGCNPIPIIVPCHRVIGSNGSLTGFGGGLANKKKLLDLESRQLRLL
jgi:methylated-DNA-[protein]-cysteine S-methyltransferase